MDCFEVLGIEPTDEIKKIKRAYAVKAKECHPEEYPEEFRVLYDAYKEALSLANITKERQADVQKGCTEAERIDEYETWQEENGGNTEGEWNNVFRQIAYNTKEHGSLNQAVRQILEQCRTLYMNETERNKLYHWKDILEEPGYGLILQTREFVTAWYEFLESHHIYSIQIWEYFDSLDGVRFSGEPFCVPRFPYQIYLNPWQSHVQSMPENNAGGNKPGSIFAHMLKRIFYPLAFAGMAVLGFAAGVAAGLIWG